MKKSTSASLTYIHVALFAALISVSAWICIPFAVPFTMQTFAVALCAGLLGAKKATLSVLIYILLGIIGLPVFSGFRAGAAVVFGATGGYTVGFIPFAALSGYLASRGEGIVHLVVSMAAGLVLCYVCGTLWYSFFFLQGGGMAAALASCVLPFVIPDLVKLFLAALCVKKLKKHLSY